MLRIIESRIFCYLVSYDLCYNVIWNFVYLNICYSSDIEILLPLQNISIALCTQAKNLWIIFLPLPKVSAKNVFFFWHELSQNVMDNLICHSEMSNFFSIQWTTYLNLSSTQSHRTRKKFVKMLLLNILYKNSEEDLEGLTCNAICEKWQIVYEVYSMWMES